jgi:hypothetical protein
MTKIISRLLKISAAASILISTHSAYAETIQIKTHATTNLAYFDLYGIFEFHENIVGVINSSNEYYELNTTSNFDTDWLSAEHFEATTLVNVEITVSGVKYSHDIPATVQASIGKSPKPGYDSMRYEINFDPVVGNTAAIIQDFYFLSGETSSNNLLSSIPLQNLDGNGNFFTIYHATFFSDASMIYGEAKGVFNSFSYSVSAVPEPSTYMMMGLGLTGLLAFSRRKSK